MDEYVRLLILAYFREHSKGYTIEELCMMIGLFSEQANCFIDRLLEEGFLEYKGYLLSISLKGRILLMHSKLEDYRFTADLKRELFKADAIDVKYISLSSFAKEKWFGNNGN